MFIDTPGDPVAAAAVGYAGQLIPLQPDTKANLYPCSSQRRLANTPADHHPGLTLPPQAKMASDSNIGLYIHGKTYTTWAEHYMSISEGILQVNTGTSRSSKKPDKFHCMDICETALACKAFAHSDLLKWNVGKNMKPHTKNTSAINFLTSQIYQEIKRITEYQDMLEYT